MPNFLPVIEEIENLIKEPIPQLEEIEESSFGYVVRNNGVTGLSLYEKEFAELPKSIVNLKFLKVLNLTSCYELKCLPDPLELDHLKSLVLKNCHELESIPASLPLSLKFLVLSNCFSLTKLPEIIDQLPNLTYLDLSYCENLKQIPTNLKLKIEQDLITIKTVGCLAFTEVQTPLIELINFKSAQIPLIEAEVLQSLENQFHFQLVKEIYKWIPFRYSDPWMGFSVERNRVIGIRLYDCGLTSLPESIGNLKSLQRVDLSHNQLETLPESIGNLSSLQLLDLSSNQLKFLPKSIGNLKSLQVIDLSYNDLQSLPDSIGNLKSLQLLNLSDNGISTLPASIGRLESLEEFFLQDNNISTLPNSIGSLKSLKELRLDSNQLVTLPESIGNLSSLTSLELLSNQLKTLPKSIGNLSSLKTLLLQINQLTILPDSTGNLESLEKLILFSNKISTLPESLGNLKSLQTLALGENKIKTVPESIRNLSSLKKLFWDRLPEIDFWKNKKLIFQLDDFIYFTWQKVTDGEVDLHSSYFREQYGVYQTSKFDNDEFWYLIKFYFLASSMEEDEYLYDIDEAYKIPRNIPPNGLKIKCICGKELERKWNLRCSLVDRQPNDDRFYSLSVDNYYLIISEKCRDCESTICIYRNYPSTHMNPPHPLCIFWFGGSFENQMVEFWDKKIIQQAISHHEEVPNLYFDDLFRFQLLLKDIKLQNYRDKLSTMKFPTDSIEQLTAIYDNLSYNKDLLAKREEFLTEFIIPLWNEESVFKGIPLSKLESLVLKELENKVGSCLTAGIDYLFCDDDETGLLGDSFKAIIKKGHIIELKLQYLLNPLLDLPSSIGWLFSLRTLNLVGAGLETLPESLEHLRNLEELNLWWNTALEDLPQTLLKLKKLKKLIVNKRSLSSPSFEKIVQSEEFRNIIQKLEDKGVWVEKWDVDEYDPF